MTLCLAVLFSVTVTYISVAIAKPVTVSDQATNCFWYQKKTITILRQKPFRSADEYISATVKSVHTAQLHNIIR